MLNLYPERQSDMVALRGLSTSSGTGSLNLGSIGAYVAQDLGRGIAGFGALAKRIYDVAVDKITSIEGLDDDWLIKLGRMYNANDSHMFNGVVVNHDPEPWHPVIAPKGYVDRFEVALQTMMVIGGGWLLRLIMMKGGIGFIGGMYGSLRTSGFRQSVTEDLEDIELLLSEIGPHQFDDVLTQQAALSARTDVLEDAVVLNQRMIKMIGAGLVTNDRRYANEFLELLSEIDSN
jgi:hypothetical protein